MPRTASPVAPHKSIGCTWSKFVEKNTSPTLALVRTDSSSTHRNKDAHWDGSEPVSPLETSFRHGWWASRRDRVHAALAAARVTSRRIEQFRQCGSNALVYVEQTSGAVRVEGITCRDRFCQACAQTRQHRLRVALLKRVPQAKTLHVVLTIRSSEAPLRDQLKELYQSFARLRRSKWWRARASGGMACLELTRSPATRLWHPHLHCLVNAEWLAQADLAEQWHIASRGSSVVHVSLVVNSLQAINEVSKYVTKPIHRSIDYDQESLVELISALHGQHMITTFGTWRSDPLMKDDEIDDAGAWRVHCTLVSLHAQAAAGNDWAQRALKYLASKAPGRVEVDPPGLPPSG